MRHLRFLALGLACYVLASLPIAAPGLVRWQRSPLLADWLNPRVEALVINPKGYFIQFSHYNSSGTDSVDRFFGRNAPFQAAWTTSDSVIGDPPVRIPLSGVITSGSVYQSVVTPGGATAAQFVALAYRRSDAANTLISDTTISSGVICQHSSCVTTALFPMTGLSVPVVEGELGKMKATTPAWTDTNPTGLYWLVDLWVSTP